MSDLRCESDRRHGESRHAYLHRLYPNLKPIVEWMEEKMRGNSGNSYEDQERLMQEPEHLREMLRLSKKTIDHQQDVIKEWQLEVLRYKKAIEAHDEVEHECYSIADRMVLESETGGQT